MASKSNSQSCMHTIIACVVYYGWCVYVYALFICFVVYEFKKVFKTQKIGKTVKNIDEAMLK